MLVDISWLFNKCFAHIDVSIFCNRIYNNPEIRTNKRFSGFNFHHFTVAKSILPRAKTITEATAKISRKEFTDSLHLITSITASPMAAVIMGIHKRRLLPFPVNIR